MSLVDEVIKRYYQRLKSDKYKQVLSELRGLRLEPKRIMREAIVSVILPALSNKELEEVLTREEIWKTLYNEAEEGYVEDNEEARRYLIEMYGTAKKAIKAIIGEVSYEVVSGLYYHLSKAVADKPHVKQALESVEEEIKSVEAKKERLEREKRRIAPLEPEDALTLDDLIAIIVVVHEIVEEVKGKGRS